MTTSACLHTSATRTRLARLAAAACLAFSAVSLSAAPAFAAEDAATEDGEEVAEQDAHGEEEGGKLQLAEGPRDRVGLIVLGFLGAVTIGGALTAARQLSGKRPQASGEFRWR